MVLSFLMRDYKPRKSAPSRGSGWYKPRADPCWMQARPAPEFPWRALQVGNIAAMIFKRLLEIAARCGAAAGSEKMCGWRLTFARD